MTTWLKATNWAKTTIPLGVSSSDTTVTCASGTFDTGDTLSLPFNAVIWDGTDPYTDTSREIVKVTNIVGNVLTIDRAEEGTSSGTHLANCNIAILVSAGYIDQIQDVIDDNEISLDTDPGLVLANNKLKMGTPSSLTASTTNAVSGANHTHAVSGFLVPNTSITAATKTKISYDINGLVTSGADATTADIADSSNKRYVTDANLLVIGNTSGTNTGDQSSLPISAAPTTQTAQGMIVSLTYGESITLGDLLYFKSDSKVYQADGNAAGKFPVMGMALATASSGAHDVLLMGIYKDSTKWAGGTVLTVGGTCYLSTSIAATTQTQPSATDDVIQVVGTAISTDTIFFNPAKDYITHT